MLNLTTGWQDLGLAGGGVTAKSVPPPPTDCVGVKRVSTPLRELDEFWPSIHIIANNGVRRLEVGRREVSPPDSQLLAHEITVVLRMR